MIRYQHKHMATSNVKDEKNEVKKPTEQKSDRNSSYRIQIGTELRSIRKIRDLTQEKVITKLITLSPTTSINANRLSQYEIGYRLPKADELTKLAKVLNVLPAYISRIQPKNLSPINMFYLLTELEDTMGFEVMKQAEKIATSPELKKLIVIWKKQKDLLVEGKIDVVDYKLWKMNFKGVE